MLQIENTLISDDIIEQKFCCDIQQCKGMCCVYGDAGAPLTDSEVGKLKDNYPIFSKYLDRKHISTIKNTGFGVYDKDGDLGTPLVKGTEECAFCCHTGETVMCACEKAYLNNETQWQKPLSCHLYPIRISTINGTDCLNYHRWNVCKSAVREGERKNIAVYQFLKAPLIRRYGEDWYNQLEYAALHYYNQQ